MLTEFNRFLYAVWSFFFFINPNDSARMQTWREQDIADMQDEAGIDASAVGKMIGAGMQHRIYEYNSAPPMVLKVSTPVQLLRFPTFLEVQDNLKFIVRFFPEYAVEPVDVVELTNGRYVIKQRRLNMIHSLTSGDLKNSFLNQQLQDIVQHNQQMLREVGRSLDFLGREGQRKCRAALFGFNATPTIANLVVETKDDGAKQLRIIDTDLENFRIGGKTLRDRQSAIAARIAVSINRFFVLRFFGVDIAPRDF
jgi:hypothetical protein